MAFYKTVMKISQQVVKCYFFPLNGWGALCNNDDHLLAIVFVVIYSIFNRLVSLLLVNNMISQLPDHLRLLKSLRTLW